MDMVQLEHFLSLVETKNFSKSADLLFISRQGLRKSISMLEQELGTKLFSRTSAGMELTGSGQIFYPTALSMTTEYRAVFGSIHESSKMQKSAIYFAMFQGFFANVSMDMIDSFFDQRPDINYISTSFNDDEVISQFLQGEFDFAITSDPVRYEQFEYFPLFRTYRCISVNASHPLARFSYIKTSALRDMHIISCGPGIFDYNWILKICNEAGFKPNLIPIQDSLTQLQYAGTGKMPTLTIPNICAPERFASEPRLLFWVPEELEKSVINVNVITIKGKTIRPEVSELIKHMQDYCSQQIEGLMGFYPFSHSEKKEK